MAETFLANISGLVKKATAPLLDDGSVNTSVIWARETDPENTAKVVLLIYDFELADWVPLYNKATQILLGSVTSFLVDPPANPTVGDAYIIGTAATGAWAGRDKQIAEYAESGWTYITPNKNSFVFVANEETFWYFTAAYPGGLWDHALGGGVASFDGSQVVKGLPQPGVAYGGTTLKEWVQNAFFYFIPATISMNDFTLQMVGTNYEPPIIGAITLNDETDVTERRIRDVTADVVLDNPVDNAVNFTAPTKAIVKGNVNSYRIEADVANNGTPATKLSPTRILKGAYPYLVGMSSQNLSASTIFAALTKVTQLEGDKEILLNGTNQYIYFGYDDDYDDLTAILNASDFNIFANFTLIPMDVESDGLANDWVKGYKIYKLNNLTTVNNGLFKFNR